MSLFERKMLFLIMMVFLAACVETDIYLPAFADMMEYYSVSEVHIQGLLTWNFVGICVSGPVYGPVSDAMGRKRPLMLALLLFLCGSVMTVFAKSFTHLLWGRVLQGIGSGGCFTLGTAMIFDAFEGQRAVEAVNRLNAVTPFLMAGAPLLGGALNAYYGCVANFLFLALLVSISLCLCGVCLDETLPIQQRKPLVVSELQRDFKSIFTCRRFWQLTMIVSLVLAGYLAFLSGSAVLFVVDLGVSKQQFPLLQASLLGSWLLASLTCSGALKRWGATHTKRYALLCLTLGTWGLGGCAGINAEDPYISTVAMIVFTFGANWMQSLCFPEAMDLLPEIKGSAASVLSSVRLFVAAVVIWVSGELYDGTTKPIAAVIAAIWLVVYILWISIGREKNKKMTVSPHERGPTVDAN